MATLERFQVQLLMQFIAKDIGYQKNNFIIVAPNWIMLLATNMKDTCTHSIRECIDAIVFLLHNFLIPET